MLLIISEEEAFWFSCVGEIRSPGSRKHCPNNNSAELPCKSSLNIVLRERMMEDKCKAQLAESSFAVSAVLIVLIALSTIPFHSGNVHCRFCELLREIYNNL